MENVRKDLLDVDLMEAVAMLQALAEGVAQGLHDEMESGERWRRKKAHVGATKILSEAIEAMANDAEIKTVKQWLLAYEQRRGTEWEMMWGDWFWNNVEQAVMYAKSFVAGILY